MITPQDVDNALRGHRTREWTNEEFRAIAEHLNRIEIKKNEPCFGGERIPEVIEMMIDENQRLITQRAILLQTCKRWSENYKKLKRELQETEA
jgi:hypothetical protein